MSQTTETTALFPVTFNKIIFILLRSCCFINAVHYVGLVNYSKLSFASSNTNRMPPLQAMNCITIEGAYVTFFLIISV